MGGWIALLIALTCPDRLAAIIGIAAAPDFTEALMWRVMSIEQRETLMRDGLLNLPSRYGQPYPITRALIEDGRARMLLDAPIAIDCPVRLLHGQRDPDVPWELSLRIAEQLTSRDVRVTLVKDGDHSLSRSQDIAMLRQTLEELLG
jgi:pimeloyl-ACP methyl ester carboxylesterase